MMSPSPPSAALRPFQRLRVKLAESLRSWTMTMRMSYIAPTVG